MGTRATIHFFKVSRHLNDVTHTSPNTSIQVSLPYGATITSTHTGNLWIPGLPISTHQAHTPQPCIQFLPIHCTTLCPRLHITLHRQRCHHHPQCHRSSHRHTIHSHRWIVDPHTTTTYNTILHHRHRRLSKHHALHHTRARHHCHQNRFLPRELLLATLSTWCTAIEAGFFATCHSLTSAALRKYPPASVAMRQGHLDQVRMNTCTTQALLPLLPTTMTSENNTQQQTTDDEAALNTAPPESPSSRTRHLHADCNATTGII
jgi:hypothetical protein